MNFKEMRRKLEIEFIVENFSLASRAMYVLDRISKNPIWQGDERCYDLVKYCQEVLASHESDADFENRVLKNLKGA